MRRASRTRQGGKGSVILATANRLFFACGQDAASKTLGIQLMGSEDPSVDEDESAEGRWRAYVASYVMVHPSEWVAGGCGPVLLKRYGVCHLGGREGASG